MAKRLFEIEGELHDVVDLPSTIKATLAMVEGNGDPKATQDALGGLEVREVLPEPPLSNEELWQLGDIAEAAGVRVNVEWLENNGLLDRRACRAKIKEARDAR